MKARLLTVGTLRRFLEKQPPDTEITFGASKSRQRPLIFFRFKIRGPNLLQIELNELDRASSSGEHHQAVGVVVSPSNLESVDQPGNIVTTLLVVRTGDVPTEVPNRHLHDLLFRHTPV